MAIILRLKNCVHSVGGGFVLNVVAVDVLIEDLYARCQMRRFVKVGKWWIFSDESDSVD